MKRDGKLSLALHALGHMAAQPDRPLRSEDLAAHGGTHAVVVRRVLGVLREAGIVRSEKGHAGGWRLARAPEAITVAEVQRLLGERLLAPPSGPEEAGAACRIERALHGAVDAALREAEALLARRLEAVTVADLAASIGPGGLPGLSRSAS